MEQEAPGARVLAGGQDAVQVAGPHGVAGVGAAPGGDPEDHLVGVAHGLQGALALGEHELLEELGREAQLHVEEVVHAGQVDAEEGAHHQQGVGLGEGGVPAAQALHPAGHGAVEAVEAAVPVVVLGEDEVEVRGHLLVVLAGEGGEGGRARDAAQLDLAVHGVHGGARAGPAGARRLPPGAQPVEGVLVDVEQGQAGQGARRGQVADPVRRQLVQAPAHGGDAAVDAVQVGADLGEAGLLAGAHLEQLAAVVEGQLVVVLAGAVDDESRHLGEGVGQVLGVAGRAPGPEDEDRPAAAGGVVEHGVQAALLLRVDGGLVGRTLAEALVDLGVRRPAAGAVEAHAAHHEAAHAAVVPGVEALLESLHPVLERVVGEDPAVHGLPPELRNRSGVPPRATSTSRSQTWPMVRTMGRICFSM